MPTTVTKPPVLDETGQSILGQIRRIADSTGSGSTFNFADDFSDTASYSVGDYVVKNGVLYRCTTDHSGAWAIADFVQVSVGDELKTKSDVKTSKPATSGGTELSLVTTGEKHTWNSAGHTMVPPNVPGTTEVDVKNAVAAAVLQGPTNHDIMSAWGIGNWSNTMTKRIIYSGTIAAGDNTIGTWLDDAELATLRAMTPTDRATAEGQTGYNWWYDAHFIGLDLYDDYSIDFKYEPQPNGDVLTMGGYILDTDTGYMCIKFGAPTSVSTNKIAVDITIVKNNVSSSGG